jgi:hypothetical protein
MAYDLDTDLGRAYREGRLDRRMRVYKTKVLALGSTPSDQGGSFIGFRGGEFSTGEMGDFHPALTSKNFHGKRRKRYSQVRLRVGQESRLGFCPRR